ncbi:hypothetical protein BDQ17DRAFT_1178259, partial [Cyathus striatus]
KQVICISIMMQSTNQVCNALQSVLGLFLHSCNAPETVCELMSCVGLSISVSTINQAMTSLSQEAYSKMKKLGKTFMTSYAYDNLDIDLKHAVPTVEKLQDTLIHLTTGTMLPLEHEVTSSDLNCSEELWKSSVNNTSGDTETYKIPFTQLLDHFSKLHKPNPSGLSQHEEYNVWKFLNDLVQFRPETFQQF